MTNPRTGADYANIFPIREYYTNKQVIPAARSWPARCGDLKIEVRCISPTQYLGMAESDLYLLLQLGQLRRQLHEGALRRLAPGDGPDGHRRLRRHVPELAGGAADDDRLLRRRPARLRVPGRLHPPEPCSAAGRSSR